MDYDDAHVRLNEASAHHTGVQEIIAGLIARRGYHSVIIDLVSAVHQLAEISLADPRNQVKQRHLSLWSEAVKDAIQRHSEESTFECIVSDSDRVLAWEMGIRLE